MMTVYLTLCLLVFVPDWKCKSLDCGKNRWEITDPIYLSDNEESLIYDYCSIQDKVVWGKPLPGSILYCGGEEPY